MRPAPFLRGREASGGEKSGGVGLFVIGAHPLDLFLGAEDHRYALVQPLRDDLEEAAPPVDGRPTGLLHQQRMAVAHPIQYGRLAERQR